jgi:hypothetical protein
MLPMWISPEGEIPLEITTGRPDAIAVSAASSAQWREAVSPFVIVCFSTSGTNSARYIGGVAIINLDDSVLRRDLSL